jgi:ABC-type sugar transport system ATPase subunit
MNLGVLQQIGTPKDLYTRPANTFVATFIGSPAMNLLPSGALGGGAGGSDQLVGFRPEHVQLGDGSQDYAHWDATVEVVQYLGDEQLAYLRLGDAEIVAKLPLEARLEPGRTERFAVPLRHLLLFDAESGEAAGSAG